MPASKNDGAATVFDVSFEPGNGTIGGEDAFDILTENHHVVGEEVGFGFGHGEFAAIGIIAQAYQAKVILQSNKETEQHFHEAYRLPDGRGLLLILHRDEGYDTIAIWAGGERRNLLTLLGSDLEGPTYSPTGHLLFTRSKSNEGLWALPFSLSSLEATGEPFLVVPWGSQASASSDGNLVYLDSRARSDKELVWFDAEGTILGTIGKPQTGMNFPVISPDGTKVAVSGEEDKDWDIWVHDEAGRKGRITFDKGREAKPRWPRDGSRVFYHHRVGPNPSIYSVDSDAGGEGGCEGEIRQPRRPKSDGSERAEVGEALKIGE